MELPADLAVLLKPSGADRKELPMKPFQLDLTKIREQARSSIEDGAVPPA